jgi:hypothetical protein
MSTKTVDRNSVNYKIWTDRSLTCQKELCAWPKLYQGVADVISTNTNTKGNTTSNTTIHKTTNTTTLR